MSTNYLSSLYKKGEEKKEDNCRKAKSQEEMNQMLRQNLVHDSDLIRDAIKEEIVDPLAIHVISRADSNEEKRVPIFNILSNDKLFCLDYHSNMKLRTFFFGFWDSDKMAYNAEKFSQAGKGLMIEEVNKVIAPLKIADISDSSLSKKFVLELIIPPNPEFPLIDDDSGFTTEKDTTEKDSTEEDNDVAGSSTDSIEKDANKAAAEVTDVSDSDGYVAVVKRGKKKVTATK